MEEIQQKLAILDRKSEELVQDGKYLESLDVMEEALTIRRNVFGETSDEYYKTSEKLCELCNMLSMIFLQKEKFEASLEFLKKAEILAQNSIELRAVTYNNMACYYRRIGKLKVALKCLEDALALEVKLDKTKTLADTHLNICAVYSQLGKHDVAMTHIMKSIILLQDELLATSTPAFDENPKHPSQSDANTKKQFEDRVAVLAIAYHNLGVEHEYLKQYEEAILTYKKAVNFARANLGEESHVCKNLQNVLETAYAQIQETKSKSKQKTFQKPTFGAQMSGTNRFKQASSVYGKEGGGSASKADGKRISHTGMDPAYKTESQHVVDNYAKPISGDLVSASSGFTPLDRPAPGSNQKKFLNDFHNDESDVGPGERKTIEESMGEYSNQLSGSER